MDLAAPPPLATFEEFWPLYVGQHRRAGTRLLHFAGTTLGILGVALAIGLKQPAFLLWGLLVSYGLAWTGHFFVEKNRPATFQHAFWSLLGDFRMYGLMWRGKMRAEAQRLGIGVSSS